MNWVPKGIVLIGWTNKEGFFVIYKHPTNLQITDEEVMRVGSAHRMRNLNANTITLREKELNVVSFFSGLITSKYHIAPNYVISLLLEKGENPRDYLKTLPKGVDIVLTEFPVKRFDARTTSFRDVLSNIGESYHHTLPKLYKALINNEIEIKQDMDDFFDSVSRDLDAPLITTDIGDEATIEELRNKVAEQDGTIRMLQTMMEGKDLTGGAVEYLAKIETLKNKLANLEQRNREKEKRISQLEIQLARIELLETRIQSFQTGITERDAEIADLRTRLTNTAGISAGTTIGGSGSTGETQVWKNKVRDLQTELREKMILVNKLKAQLSGSLDSIEARALLSEASQKTVSQSPFDEDLEDEIKSRYITL